MDREINKRKFLALLFYETELSKKRLDNLLPEWQKALSDLKEDLYQLGLTVLNKENSLELGLSKELSKYITSIDSKDLEQDLSETASQILTLVLHCAPISKYEIDYIRGVNSASSIKRLLLQGLIEKRKSKSKTLYYPTMQLLADMGIEDHEKFKEGSEFCKKIKELLFLEEDAYENNQ